MAPGSAPTANPEAVEWVQSWRDDGNPNTMSRGEQAAAWVNRAGESLTMGLVGDEAAARFDAMTGRGDYDDRLAFYRGQEAQYQDQHPGDALSTDVAGALIGPGKFAAGFINRGVGFLPRLGRATAVGTASGGITGAMDPMEGLTDSRISGALLGAAIGGTGAAALTGVGQGFIRAAQALRGCPEAATVSS